MKIIPFRMLHFEMEKCVVWNIDGYVFMLANHTVAQTVFENTRIMRILIESKILEYNTRFKGTLL